MSPICDYTKLSLFCYLQLVEHPLHFLIDLIGGRATQLRLLIHALLTFRDAHWIIALVPPHCLWSWFPRTASQGRGRCGHLLLHSANITTLEKIQTKWHRRTQNYHKGAFDEYVKSASIRNNKSA